MNKEEILEGLKKDRRAIKRWLTLCSKNLNNLKRMLPTEIVQDSSVTTSVDDCLGLVSFCDDAIMDLYRIHEDIIQILYKIDLLKRKKEIE